MNEPSMQPAKASASSGRRTDEIRAAIADAARELDELRNNWLNPPELTTIHAVSSLPFERTDCSLPMLYAMQRKLDVDAFVVYTDNETWAGNIHPVQALAQYRQKTGIAAKLIVVGMTATQFSIADPNDAGMMDVVGFDTSAPAVMTDFCR